MTAPLAYAGLKAIWLLLAAGYAFFLYRVNKLLDI